MAQQAVCKFESQFNVVRAEEAYMEWFWDAFGAVDTDDSNNVAPCPELYMFNIKYAVVAKGDGDVPCMPSPLA